MSKAKPIINLTEPAAEVTDADDLNDDEFHGNTDDHDVDELMMMKIATMMKIILIHELFNMMEHLEGVSPRAP